MEDPEAYKALFLVGEDGKEIVTPWCHGYMRAVAMRPHSWLGLPDDIQQHQGSIALFGSATGEESLNQQTEEIVEKLQRKIDPAARAIHAYWLEQRRDQIPPAQPHIADPKTGRNDPCPRGSGKKYKKCCLH
ncbi:UPF0149 family protein [Microbulbifer sp. SH-1]|uniref:UPF0149 family protein n=1 Tax=Microbulbifer sp. SH-1 TaxID=2681547 RepID=UPI001F103209|nr:UPF0149 family protein [Microbulbifer sp. SH-1]